MSETIPTFQAEPVIFDFLSLNNYPIIMKVEEMNNKTLAVIVLNWNGKAYIKECLDSIDAQNYKGFDVFFVDNASTDGSQEIGKKFKNFRFIKNGKNLGFARGNNVAIEKAISEGYRLVALINPDTVLEKDCLGRLVRAFEDKKVGAVQAKILIHKTKLINTTGNELQYLGFSYCGGYKQPENSGPRRLTEIAAASGAAAVFRVDVLKKTGLLDDNFFMYLEDTDLSWRIREYGYEVLYQPEAIIYHKYNFSRNKSKLFYIERNRLLFIIKNYQMKTILVLLPALIFTELLMLLYALTGGWLLLKLESYASIFRFLGSTLSQREEIQSRRTVGDKALKRFWVSSLQFDEVSSPLFTPLNWFYKAYWQIFGWII